MVDDYRVLADGLAADIAAGRLQPGDRLPPQRRFARRHAIAASTAARAYGELIRRGLAVGEVGRGTFVRAAQAPVQPALAEPGSARVDLELNFPLLLGEQSTLLAESLRRMLRPDVLDSALLPVGAAGTLRARQAAAALLARGGWTPTPEQVLFAGNGRQAIAATIATLVPVGERLGVEALTYPVVKGIAARLGITLVPLAMDEHGLIPDAVSAAHRAAPMRAVYLQPALHNPLGTTMPEHRRAELTDTLRGLDIYVIEDAIYGFLREDLPPLVQRAPERTVLVDSLSKRIAPGLTLGFMACPASVTERIGAALRSGAWTAPRFALDAATQWITDGTATTIAQAKRNDALVRQQIVRERLAGCTIHADPHAYHCWWVLPDPWRADTFVAAAARHDIAVTPAAAFTIGPAHAPNAIRLALASPALDTLVTALDTLNALARKAPEDIGPE